MSKVFVLDTEKQPLEPVHPGRARLLLKEGKAGVYRRFPFTIMLKRAVEEPAPAPLRLKIDPGAKTTGLALLNDADGEVVWAAELSHLSNLCLACEPCNLAKGTQDVRDFLKEQPERLNRILSQVKAPLRDATAVNASRWHLFHCLQATGLPLETGSGGCTKYNRAQRNVPKTHWCDAACVGASTHEVLQTKQVVPLLIVASGRGHRRIMLVDERGFPRGWRKRKKRYFGYQTGDHVRAVVPQGARKGTHAGRVAVKASGYFTIQTKVGKVPDVAHRYCKALHRTDGYGYQFGARLSPPSTSTKGAPVSFSAF